MPQSDWLHLNDTSAARITELGFNNEDPVAMKINKSSETWKTVARRHSKTSDYVSVSCRCNCHRVGKKVVVNRKSQIDGRLEGNRTPKKLFRFPCEKSKQQGKAIKAD